METDPMNSQKAQPQQYPTQMINQPIMTQEQFIQFQEFQQQQKQRQQQQEYQIYLSQQLQLQSQQQQQVIYQQNQMIPTNGMQELPIQPTFINPQQQVFYKQPFQMNPTNPAQGIPIEANQSFYNFKQPPPQQQHQYPENTVVPEPKIQTKQKGFPNNADGCGYPATIECCFCKTRVKTKIHREIGCETIYMSLLMLCCTPCLFFLPCCIDECQDKVHNCPNCNQIVGTKKFEIC